MGNTIPCAFSLNVSCLYLSDFFSILCDFGQNYLIYSSNILSTISTGIKLLYKYTPANNRGFLTFRVFYLCKIR